MFFFKINLPSSLDFSFNAFYYINALKNLVRNCLFKYFYLLKTFNYKVWSKVNIIHVFRILYIKLLILTNKQFLLFKTQEANNHLY